MAWTPCCHSAERRADHVQFTLGLHKMELGRRKSPQSVRSPLPSNFPVHPSLSSAENEKMDEQLKVQNGEILPGDHDSPALCVVVLPKLFNYKLVAKWWWVQVSFFRF